MHGLAVLFHYIVCNVNNVVDGANAVSSQTALHPLRRRRKLNVFHNTGSITGAKLVILNGDFNVIIHILVVSGFGYYRREEFLLKRCGCLSGQADNGKTIYTVGCDFVLDNNIIQTKIRHCVLADGSILRQNVESLRIGIRIHVGSGTKLLDGAHHTVRLHAAKLAGFDFYAAGRCFSVCMGAGYAAAV